MLWIGKCRTKHAKHADFRFLFSLEQKLHGRESANIVVSKLDYDCGVRTDACCSAVWVLVNGTMSRRGLTVSSVPYCVLYRAHCCTHIWWWWFALCNPALYIYSSMIPQSTPMISFVSTRMVYRTPSSFQWHINHVLWGIKLHLSGYLFLNSCLVSGNSI